MALPNVMLPDEPRAASFQTRLVRKEVSSDPMTGKTDRQTRAIGKQFWELMLKYSPMNAALGSAWAAQLEALTGGSEFGVLIPDLTKTGVSASPGKHVNIDNSTKVYRIVDPGAASPVDLVTTTTGAGGNVYSNAIAVTNGETIGVYLDVSTAGVSVVSLSTANNGAGAVASDAFTIRKGRNILHLTPTQSGNVYLEVTNKAVEEVKAVSAVNGISISGVGATMTPTPLVEHADSKFFPLPAFVMKCSRESSIQEVNYSEDGFVRLELDLFERS